MGRTEKIGIRQAVENGDFFARGLLSALESLVFDARIGDRVACLPFTMYKYFVNVSFMV
jgi:hypothetical protein